VELVAGVLIAASLMSAEPPPKALSDIESARVERGETYIHVTRDPKGGAGIVEAVIDIAVSPMALWTVMLDCARAPKFVESLKSCRVLERDPSGAWDVREHVVDIGMILPNFRSVFRSDYVKNHMIRFRQIEGTMDLVEGTWWLTPKLDGAGTRLFYRARVATSLPVPDSLLRAIMEDDAPKTLQALKTEAERATPAPSP
jgi:ribosome-associated toxin RatA of RatAB toxin-antitoxin module